ncbi:MAG: hypothetical protein NZ585_04995 [Chloracidobacterium sp.]|nr:hypothetical protein [Chloracidobacterium sp.]
MSPTLNGSAPPSLTGSARMYWLIIFLLLVYLGVGVYTFVQALKMRANPAAAALAGLIWPLFWMVGKQEQERRLSGRRGGYLP